MRDLLRTRRVRIVVAAGAAVLLAAAVAWLVLTDAYPDEGPWLSITATHGIHVGDVMLVSIWALIVAALGRWVLAGRPPVPPGEDVP